MLMPSREHSKARKEIYTPNKSSVASKALSNTLDNLSKLFKELKGLEDTLRNLSKILQRDWSQSFRLSQSPTNF